MKSNPKGFAYEQLADALKAHIESGALRAGDKLPSLRRMAKQNGVSLATAVAAMERLESFRLVESRPRSGYYVRLAPSRRTVSLPPPPQDTAKEVSVSRNIQEIVSLAQNNTIIKTGIANLSSQLLPTSTLNRAMATTLRRQPQILARYHQIAGDLALRQQIALRHRNLGTQVDVDNIVITTGATEGLSLALHSLCQRGDVVAVPSPAYFTVLQLIESMGLLAVEIDTDPQHGMRVQALRTAFAKHPIKAVILSATLSNPDGTTMPESERLALVELLLEKNVPLINDQAMNELNFERDAPTPLSSLQNRGLIITVNSVSKWLAPSLRVGWVLCGAYQQRIVHQKQMTTSNTNLLAQAGLAVYLREGHAERHLSKLRRACRDQLYRMLDAVDRYFPQPQFIAPRGGFLAWIRLPPGIDTLAMFPGAIERGLSYTPGALFSSTARHNSHIRLCAYRPWSTQMELAMQDLGHYFEAALDAPPAKDDRPQQPAQ